MSRQHRCLLVQYEENLAYFDYVVPRFLKRMTYLLMMIDYKCDSLVSSITRRIFLRKVSILLYLRASLTSIFLLIIVSFKDILVSFNLNFRHHYL